MFLYDWLRLYEPCGSFWLILAIIEHHNSKYRLNGALILSQMPCLALVCVLRSIRYMFPHQNVNLSQNHTHSQLTSSAVYKSPTLNLTALYPLASTPPSPLISTLIHTTIFRHLDGVFRLLLGKPIRTIRIIVILLRESKPRTLTNNNVGTWRIRHLVYFGGVKKLVVRSATVPKHFKTDRNCQIGSELDELGILVKSCVWKHQSLVHALYSIWFVLLRNHHLLFDQIMKAWTMCCCL